MNWLNWLPFRRRYWIIRMEVSRLEVVKARTALFATEGGCWVVQDGPFNYQDDAIRALQFWKLQNQKQYH